LRRPAETILLASSSPRRRQLLELSGAQIAVRPAKVDETPRRDEAPRALVQRLADGKAAQVLESTPGAELVLGADTVVVLDGLILGKPASAAEALEMLMRLSGRSHRVITALSLYDRASRRKAVCTTETVVPMRDFSRAEAEAYVASGSPLDKAGAYGIQDDDMLPVDLSAFQGCFANVMGLPLCRLGLAVAALDCHLPADFNQACQSFGFHPVEAWDGRTSAIA
jgi:septum formation protein